MTPHWLDEFERCRPWLSAALASGSVQTHTIGDVFALIAKGAAQLWPLPEAVIVTVMDRFPNGVQTVSAWAGGRLEDIEAAIPGIEEWAARQGCTHVFIKGRPGWQRMMFPKLGYHLDQVVMVKELAHVASSEPKAA